MASKHNIYNKLKLKKMFIITATLDKTATGYQKHKRINSFGCLKSKVFSETYPKFQQILMGLIEQ